MAARRDGTERGATIRLYSTTHDDWITIFAHRDGIRAVYEIADIMTVGAGNSATDPENLNAILLAFIENTRMDVTVYRNKPTTEDCYCGADIESWTVMTPESEWETSEPLLHGMRMRSSDVLALCRKIMDMHELEWEYRWETASASAWSTTARGRRRCTATGTD